MLDAKTEQLAFMANLGKRPNSDASLGSTLKEKVEVMTQKTQDFLDKSKPVTMKVIDGVKGFFNKAKAKVKEIVTEKNALGILSKTGEVIGKTTGAFIEGYKNGYNRVNPDDAENK